MALREQWRSRWGFVLAAAGSAVGLGNLWGFAYRASEGGGAAFLLLYILIVLVVCLPVLVSEMVLGRSTGSSPLLAPVNAAGPRWSPMGWLFVIAPLGIGSYYAVLMGWTLDTLIHSIFFGLPSNLSEAETFFGSISSGSSVLLGQLISLLLTAIVVSAGVRGGIERLSRLGVPILFGLLLILALWAATLSGTWEGYRTFLLKLDASQFFNPSTIRNAFTQAFFSLSLGIGIMVAYSSYLDKKNQLPKEAVSVASIDTAVGLLAGMITFPIVMSFGLKEVISGSTVGTLFISLPTGLGTLGLTGRVVAILFFALAYIAAITSSISLLEVPVSSIMDRLGWGRSKAVFVSTGLLFVLGIPSALNLDVLGKMDSIFGGVLLILGGFLLSIFLGWVVPNRFDEDLAGCNSNHRVRRYLKFMLRWVSPPVIAFGLIVSVVDLFQNWSS
ncbi:MULTISPECIES: sodium-dependent transporter [Prochlorococcus]|uniref:Na+-dependent transporter of the SNF family n=1 Tax=Prochlorococcus marinus (strain SARG / CCMP1375 / SS120) TaxID=167539 RepID=Q7VAL0_PROMA|nr:MULTISPECIES: sodium-dependent transporter [Prochlorococcus]AAQ00496.1 Na+-dependent transporter of the SNF family [Prochlorococcus marinus subsp. marinus str. CCMP1375]KGG14381.1 putative sodium-dependent transporter [Prochlorococcus marinus str. LG]KGG22045.1 putative sodium-dependent transporter [Prochlorococcus marinus str. SS2]KGG24637.1 putative sodium-dependent transporter [Prochlorococcus marinus str. SS35]KGG33530.1 putative sodium-dependent transporter [Prochlorococcus marinus str